LKRHVEASLPEDTTRVVAQGLVKPYSQANECRFFEQMPADEPKLFVGQIQDSSFCGLVDAVKKHLVNAAPRKFSFGFTMYLFAINQRKANDELKYLDASIQGSEKSALVVMRGPKPEVTLLTPVSCARELGRTVRLRGEMDDAFPRAETDLPAAVWSEIVAKLDIRESFSKIDKRMIPKQLGSKDGRRRVSEPGLAHVAALTPGI
jgi:hypothetical protein